MSNPIKVKVVAIGGAGIKIAERLRAGELSNFDFMGIDLTQEKAAFEVLSVGGTALGFLGSGGDPEVAERACVSHRDEITDRLRGNDLVFILAGLGGGTASAIAPMVVECARNIGSVAMAFVTLPFSVEGSRRQTQAKESLQRLRSLTPLVVAIPNDQLTQNQTPTGPEANLCGADGIISKSIHTLTTSFGTAGLIEADFVALQKLVSGKPTGRTLLALGSGEGPEAAAGAFVQAASCEMLHTCEIARHADHLLISLRVSPAMELPAVAQLAAQLAEKFGCRGQKLISAMVKPDWVERVEILVLGTQDAELRKKNTPPAAPKAPKVKVKAPNPQMEMLLGSPTEERGMFEDDEPNLYRGEDVDVPTFIRKGVKLVS